MGSGGQRNEENADFGHDDGDDSARGGGRLRNPARGHGVQLRAV